jgi:AcrR family transcriptional regulator
MTKSPTLQHWITTGYTLFALEGLEGIQVERIARTVNLNKSGFYHYFGDRENFLKQLTGHHLSIAATLAREMSAIEKFDPEFFHILLRHTEPVLFHMQLVRNRQHEMLSECYAHVNDVVETALVPSWAAFIGTPDNHEFARKYFEQARDMFYSRITPERMNEEFLRNLVYEVKKLIQEIK